MKEATVDDANRKADLSSCITPLNGHAIMQISLLSSRKTMGAEKVHLYST